MVMAPDKEVVPVPLVVRFLIPVKFAPIVVSKLKVNVKLRLRPAPAPLTPKVNVGVVPERVVSSLRITASV